MYFPFIRAKQFDLSAIFELNSKVYKTGKVLPILEPVSKIVTVQYRRLAEKNIPFILVVNPSVGSMQSIKTNLTIKERLIDETLIEYENFILGFIIRSGTEMVHVKDFIKQFPNHRHAFIHFHEIDNANELSKIIAADRNNRYNIFLEHRVSIDYINKIGVGYASDILIRDGFRKQKKNELYPQQSHFSDLHKTYRDLNYDGFGDFTIVGESFDEGGGPAFVVAIHITDKDLKSNLLIKHFKSDILIPPSPVDPGGKFLQALKRAKSHIDVTPHLKSSGIEEYLGLHKSLHFPGLGTVKKISIMHHIEFVFESM